MVATDGEKEVEPVAGAECAAGDGVYVRGALPTIGTRWGLPDSRRPRRPLVPLALLPVLECESERGLDEAEY